MVFINIPKFLMDVINRLQGAGFKAYVVGGAIRDVFLNRPVTDWDLATSASPQEVESLFYDIRSFCLKHKTVTLVEKGALYELTSMRGDEKAGFDIETDLGHRDFTLNAMAYDVVGKSVIDPYGGREDITKRIIRSVGNPEDRFIEDPLRLLRSVRFAIEFGFRIEQGTMNSLCQLSGLLALTARERIRDELMKILMSQRPSVGFSLLRRSGLLKQFLPELLEGFRKKQNNHHRYTIYRHIMETVDIVKPDPLLRLVALFHDIAKHRVRKRINGEFRFFGHAGESARLAGEIMRRLRFSRNIIKEVTKLVSLHMINYEPQWTDGAIRRLMRKAGPERFDRLLSFRKADLWAHGRGDEGTGPLLELEDRIGSIKDNRNTANDLGDLAIGGDIVMDILGIPPGPDVGRALDMLMEKVTDQPSLNTKKGLIGILKGMT
jgi:poly(A) polymerase/tRNA nucleotidyltransferase (CCA-adding enzyme)